MSMRFLLQLPLLCNKRLKISQVLRWLVNLAGTISISQVAGRGPREDSGGNSSSYSTAGAGRSQDMMMMTASESEVK